VISRTTRGTTVFSFFLYFDTRYVLHDLRPIGADTSMIDECDASASAESVRSPPKKSLTERAGKTCRTFAPCMKVHRTTPRTPLCRSDAERGTLGVGGTLTSASARRTVRIPALHFPCDDSQLILQAQENRGQTKEGVRTPRDGICTPPRIPTPFFRLDCPWDENIWVGELNAITISMPSKVVQIPLLECGHDQIVDSLRGEHHSEGKAGP
jgi:hypothetical protein